MIYRDRLRVLGEAVIANKIKSAITTGMILAITLSTLFAGFQSLAMVTETRQAELLNLLKHDCGSCHGLTRKGGLGAPLKPAKIAHRSDAALLSIILDGMPGTPMPPWRPLLTEQEARWLIKSLRTEESLP